MQINVKHLTLCSLVTVSWLPVRPQNWPCCCSWRLISVSNSILRNALASSCCAVVSLSSNVFTFPCSSSSRSMPPVTLFSKSLAAAWESSQQDFLGHIYIIVPNVLHIFLPGFDFSKIIRILLMLPCVKVYITHLFFSVNNCSLSLCVSTVSSILHRL